MNILTQDVPSLTACVTFLLETVGICNYCCCGGPTLQLLFGHYILGLWTDHLQQYTYSQSVGLQKYPRHLEMTHTKCTAVNTLKKPVTDVAVHLCTAQYNNSFVAYPMTRGQHPSSYDRIRNATSNAETVVQTRVTKKRHSSILLEAVSPKYKCTASVWIVCNTMSLSHPESLDRSSHGYFQILLDTDESPALTLHTCTGPVTYADR